MLSNRGKVRALHDVLLTSNLAHEERYAGALAKIRAWCDDTYSSAQVLLFVVDWSRNNPSLSPFGQVIHNLFNTIFSDDSHFQETFDGTQSHYLRVANSFFGRPENSFFGRAESGMLEQRMKEIETLEQITKENLEQITKEEKPEFLSSNIDPNMVTLNSSSGHILATVNSGKIHLDIDNMVLTSGGKPVKMVVTELTEPQEKPLPSRRIQIHALWIACEHLRIGNAHLYGAHAHALQAASDLLDNWINEEISVQALAESSVRWCHLYVGARENSMLGRVFASIFHSVLQDIDPMFAATELEGAYREASKNLLLQPIYDDLEQIETTFNKPRIRKENPVMATTAPPTMLTTLRHDATDAAWRTAGSQFVKLAREPLVALLSRHLGPDDDALRGKVAAFLETEIGTALLASMLSAGLAAMPASTGDVAGRMARELRIKALADAGDVFADVLMEPLRQVASMYLHGDMSISATAAPATPELLTKPATVVTNGQTLKVPVGSETR